MAGILGTNGERKMLDNMRESMVHGQNTSPFGVREPDAQADVTLCYIFIYVA
jgi:hypothetical protein